MGGQSVGLAFLVNLLLALVWILDPCVGANANNSTEDDCRDLHPACEEWAMEDKCWGSDPYKMITKCAVSCGGCPTKDCYNKPEYDSQCDSLAHQGECRHNRVWMSENCFRSCGYCRQAEIRELQKNMVTTPKPPPKEACKDVNRACPDWALEGQCWINPIFMVKHCESSCWACPEVHDCHDRKVYVDKCPSWLKAGVCHKSKTWMYHNCYRACGYCRRENIRWRNIQSQYTTTASPSVECRQIHQKCPTWAKQGECWKNPHYMVRNCQKSCGTCPSNKDCNDHDDFKSRCPSLAKRGYCTKNTKWMRAYCYRSCGFCNEASLVGNRDPIIPPTLTKGDVTCRDIHPGCAVWALLEQCWINPFYMVPNCPVSCKTCPSIHDCHDKFEFKHDCQEWTAIGYCEKSKSWMKENCFRSCGYCMLAEFREKYGNGTAIPPVNSEGDTVISTKSDGCKPASGLLVLFQVSVIFMWIINRV